ncbi:major histocompatibility complex class I-related protein 1-like [Lithobates pipiens]
MTAPLRGISSSDMMGKRGIFIPTMNEAQISTQRWNSPEERWGEREKNYLENLCIPYLKRSIEYGRGDLERRGIHSFQVMSGCELRDDGTTEGYFQFGYDGRDFIYLDTQRWIYIPTMNEAQISTQRWDSPEERWGERQKNYLENLCIPYLKRSIEYGRGDLER